MAIEEPESFEVYHRLSRLEQELHTLKFRADELAEHNLPIRVANLEPVVKSIGADVSRIEASTEKLASAVQGMKSWGVGFIACLSVIVILIGLFPTIKGWFS